MILRDDLAHSVSDTPNARIVPRDDFIVPGQLDALAPTATFDPAWNAHVVTDAEKYGQLLVEWCDTGSEQFCQSFGGPSSGWRSRNTDVGIYGVIMGLEIKDLTDCAGVAGACPDVLEAEHSSDGTHDKLGGNVLSGHDYEVSFWRNQNGALLQTSSLSRISAMQLHLRYAPLGAFVRVSLPLDRAPSAVKLYRGEANPSFVDITACPACPLSTPPNSALEWYYDPLAQRVHLYLDAAVDLENASVLLLLP